MQLEVDSISDVGRTREHNEDFMGMWRPTDAAQRRRKGELFLVADGIGGHQSGEIASRMAIERIIQAYSNAAGQDVVAELVQAIETANAAIYAIGQDQDRRWRMGTTVVGALVRDHELHVVNVGDSRAYLVRSGKAEQISQDHSIVAEQVRLGLLDAEQAENQEYRSAITRAVGNKPEVKVDTFTRTLQEGDIVVLCTDGLSGPVKRDEIAHLVSTQTPAQAVTSLAALANARGGKDNITTIVIKTHRDRKGAAARPSQAAARPMARRLGWIIGALALSALALAGVLAAAMVFLLGNRDVPRQSPIIAEIEYSADQSRDEFARMMGYSDAKAMVIEARLLPDPPWSLKPRQIYVLLTGRVVGTDAGKFDLDMGGERYRVGCPPNVTLRVGKLVSVLGVVPDPTSRDVRLHALDVNELNVLRLSMEWQNRYNEPAGPRELLVYTVVSSYTVLEAGGYNLERDYGIKAGERVALYGTWDIVPSGSSRYLGLRSLARIWRWENGIYRRVP